MVATNVLHSCGRYFSLRRSLHAVLSSRPVPTPLLVSAIPSLSSSHARGGCTPNSPLQPPTEEGSLCRVRVHFDVKLVLQPSAVLWVRTDM
jgi:hypothetical protein